MMVPDALLLTALSGFIGLHGARLGNVQVLDMDEGHGTLHIRAHHGFERSFLQIFERVSADDQSACGRALRLRRTIVVADTEKDDAFADYRAVARKAGYRSVISTPLVSRWDHIVGIISAHFPHPFVPSRTATQKGEILAQQLAHDILSVFEPQAILAPPSVSPTTGDSIRISRR